MIRGCLIAALLRASCQGGGAIQGHLAREVGGEGTAKRLNGHEVCHLGSWFGWRERTTGREQWEAVVGKE